MYANPVKKKKNNSIGANNSSGDNIRILWPQMIWGKGVQNLLVPIPVQMFTWVLKTLESLQRTLKYLREKRFGGEVVLTVWFVVYESSWMKLISAEFIMGKNDHLQHVCHLKKRSFFYTGIVWKIEIVNEELLSVLLICVRFWNVDLKCRFWNVALSFGYPWPFAPSDKADFSGRDGSGPRG